MSNDFMLASCRFLSLEAALPAGALSANFVALLSIDMNNICRPPSAGLHSIATLAHKIFTPQGHPAGSCLPLVVAELLRAAGATVIKF